MKNVRLFVFFLICWMAMAHADYPTVDIEEVKREITLELSRGFNGTSHEQPIVLLVGGYPGAGKTTLLNALSHTHDLVIISWNAVRQALLDRGLRGSPFDWEIIEGVYQNLLKMCMQRHLNVAIDANAHAKNIREIESFLHKEPDAEVYRIVKLCLNPSVETLFARIRSRIQRADLHQGTESDLERDLKSSKKKIDFNDYALVVNTEVISLETELNIIHAFLEPYHFKRN